MVTNVEFLNDFSDHFFISAASVSGSGVEVTNSDFISSPDDRWIIGHHCAHRNDGNFDASFTQRTVNNF